MGGTSLTSVRCGVQLNQYSRVVLYTSPPLGFGSLPSTATLKEADIPICINEQQVGGSRSEQIVGSKSVLVAPTCTEQLGMSSYLMAGPKGNGIRVVRGARWP